MIKLKINFEKKKAVIS